MLPIPASDNCMNFLGREEVKGGPNPSKFEIMWFEAASLLPLMKEWY